MDRFFLTALWLVIAALIICFYLLSRQDKTWDNRPGSFALFFCYPLMGVLFAALCLVHHHLNHLVQATSYLPG